MFALLLRPALAAGLAFAALVPPAAGAPQAVPPLVDPTAPSPAPLPGRGFVVVPQRSVFSLDGGTSPVRVASVTARIAIVEQVATTQLEIVIRNVGARVEPAELLVPVPDGIALRSLELAGTSARSDARLLSREEARATYEAIVRRSLDPALLEFVDRRFVRSSVFPVPPGGEQMVQLTWEQVLSASGDRVDYVLPRSEALDPATAPWSFLVRIESTRPVSTVYSPSHRMQTRVSEPNRVFLESEGSASREPGPFQLTFLLGGTGVSGTLMACPDPETGGGWFLLLGGVPAQVPPEVEARTRRTLVLALDRSGSMAGAKFEQAREAARQAVEALRPGEHFNLIDYSDSVARFAPSPVAKDDRTLAEARRYLAALAPGGGTRLHDALLESVRQTAAPGSIPLVLFLTDGRPTVGVTDEQRIREDVEAANGARYRVFTFGLGDDVNAPLLDRIADVSRGRSAFVRPQEDVEAAVGVVFARLRAPSLAEPKLRTLDSTGAVSTRVVRDVVPDRLEDLYPGDQLVVLGRYLSGERLRFRLEGDCAGEHRFFQYDFDPGASSEKNSHVARLWASRRIGVLLDEARQSGASGGLGDARTRELVDEVVRLSRRFGVLTQYTSFFATEGVDLSKQEIVEAQVRQALSGAAQTVRVGRGAIAQSTNVGAMRRLARTNRLQLHVDGELRETRFGVVQQVASWTLFPRGGAWVDAALYEQGDGRDPLGEPDRRVAIGTDDYFALVTELRQSGRDASVLAVPGTLRLRVGGRLVLVERPGGG